MIEIKNNEAISTEGKLVKNLINGAVSKKSQVAPTMTVADFVEVDSEDSYSEEEYKSLIQELIHRRYSLDDEIAIWANMAEAGEKTTDKAIEYKNEFKEYRTYRKQCKEEARQILSNR